jgi:hypothetical protein
VATLEAKKAFLFSLIDEDWSQLRYVWRNAMYLCYPVYSNKKIVKIVYLKVSVKNDSITIVFLLGFQMVF